MTTRLVQSLADDSDDMTDDAYDLMESDTRAALIALVAPECDLVFVPGTAEENTPGTDRFLYLGTHPCSNRTIDDTDAPSIELLAWIAEGNEWESGEDYVTWNFVSAASSGVDYSPITYCPYCGLHLTELITNHLPEALGD